MPFSSPSWRSLNPLKGSLNHPRKVILNHQAVGFGGCFLFEFGFPWQPTGKKPMETGGFGGPISVCEVEV